MNPEKLLSIVARYYGLRSIKQLAGSSWPVWRYDVYEEARQMACLMLQRHCDLSLDELQVALKKTVAVERTRDTYGRGTGQTEDRIGGFCFPTRCSGC